MKKRKKKKLSDEELAQMAIKRKDAAFRKKIRDVFTAAGFSFFNTMNKHIKIGHRIVEVDAVFIYENIILVCEDTGAATKDKDHIRTKKEAFDEISSNFSDYYRWLCSEFVDKANVLQKYSPEDYRIFNLYFSQTELGLSDDERARFPNIIFIEPQTLSYFNRMAQCIKRSFRFEILRFFGLCKEDIGSSSSESGRKVIKAPIIYPRDTTGLKNGVRVVSFMMSAESLLSTCYVMRKDNWEDSVRLYQRLIDKEKIKKIRTFLVQKEAAFFNNIIVGLPDDVRFVNRDKAVIPLEKISNFENCVMEIPDRINSICVIDGQHRIFAHYEGQENDRQETKIADLRQKLHLLVTGLVFPKEMPEIERIQIQSEIFLDINSNAKPVPADVLLHIEMMKSPLSDIGLARQVIERLNRKKVFLNKFALSALEEPKIKVASIIKFALRYLVTLTPSEERESFYAYWQGDKNALERKETEALYDYLEFCANNLSIYFSAIRNNFRESWEDANSKILSVISINGFIIAFNRQLQANGIQDFTFFDECFKHLKVDFSKDGFMYTSSQYRKFSDQILTEAFSTTAEVWAEVAVSNLPVKDSILD